MGTIEANWYDYPQYFDMAFRDETRSERAFLEAVFRKYCLSPVRRVLELGCGGGRLVVALARRGFDVTGLELNRKSLDYARQRLQRRGLRAKLLHADMANFQLRRPVDAAVCTWNTFRHLTTEQSARRHLRSVARCLQPGGVYVLGLHLLPLYVSEQCVERWSARHGRTKVSVTLRVITTDRRRRIEVLRATMRVQAGSRELALRSEFPLRMYTATQFRKLLATVPELELCDVFDFWYDVEHPLKLDDEITDTVFILRKRMPTRRPRANRDRPRAS